MEQLLSNLTGDLGPQGPMLLVGGLGIVLIVIAAATFLTRKPDPIDRLKSERQEKGKAPAEKASLRRGGKSKEDKLEKFAHYLEPQSADELSAARMKLLRAGYRDNELLPTSWTDFRFV